MEHGQNRKGELEKQPATQGVSQKMPKWVSNTTKQGVHLQYLYRTYSTKLGVFSHNWGSKRLPSVYPVIK